MEKVLEVYIEYVVWLTSVCVRYECNTHSMWGLLAMRVHTLFWCSLPGANLTPSMPMTPDGHDYYNCPPEKHQLPIIIQNVGLKNRSTGRFINLTPRLCSQLYWVQTTGCYPQKSLRSEKLKMESGIYIFSKCSCCAHVFLIKQVIKMPMPTPVSIVYGVWAAHFFGRSTHL